MQNCLNASSVKLAQSLLAGFAFSFKQRLKVPRIAAHILNAELGLPTEKLQCQCRIAPVGSDVAGAALADHVGQFLATSLGEGGDDLEYRGAGAGAQVKDLDAGLAVHPVKGGNVTRGQIAHVDVVAHAGAVRGGVVVAEHMHLFQLADRRELPVAIVIKPSY